MTNYKNGNNHIIGGSMTVMVQMNNISSNRKDDMNFAGKDFYKEERDDWI